jgi:hypothetical protein
MKLQMLTLNSRLPMLKPSRGGQVQRQSWVAKCEYLRNPSTIFLLFASHLMQFHVPQV